MTDPTPHSAPRETRSERLARLRIVHEKVSENRRVGSLPPPWSAYGDWRADTACGQEVTTLHVTKKPERVTCEECIRARAK